MANTQTFKTLKLDGEALYLRPWENQRGERYGPPDRDQYEVTLVNLTEESMAAAKAAGRLPTISSPNSSKHNAGILEYYKITSQYPIKFADSQGDPIEDGTHVGNGSKIRAYVEVREISKEYQKGNTHKFYATAVQLIKLVKMPEDPNFVANSGVQFDKVENGYVATATEAKGFDEVKPEFDPILDDEIPF
tara:strand:- start:319 stop:891 length:573 start_codon:yes stop_codon:yes gene_type:complete